MPGFRGFTAQNKTSTVEGRLRCSKLDLQLQPTLNGGQSFRWKKMDEEQWTGIFGHRIWTLSQTDDYVVYKVTGTTEENCLPEQYKFNEANGSEDKNCAALHEKLLRDYFRLNEDIRKLYSHWSEKDANLKKIASKFHGVRVLQQDPVENLFTFICSSNNHIARITSMVEKLCTFYGDKLAEVDGTSYYDFPPITALADPGVEEKLRQSGFGYRAKFIHQSAVKIMEFGGMKWLYNLHTLSKITSMVEKLCTFYGDKLAEVDGTSYYDFPPITALADPGVEEKLRQSGFGYRAKFIHQSAVKIMEFGGMKWLYNLHTLSKITSMVEKLCTFYGDKLAEVDGTSYYDFPPITALADPGVEEKLRQSGFGYRAKFIHQSAVKIMEFGGMKWLYNLQKLPYAEAKLELMKLPGIGAKVADCICLMSLNHLEAVPVDTHVFQISLAYLPHLKSCKSVTTKVYNEIGDYFRSLYGDYAGWAHTVLFCADLKIFQNTSEKRKSDVTTKYKTKTKKSK